MISTILLDMVSFSKTNNWFLYEVQHWAEMDYSSSETCPNYIYGITISPTRYNFMKTIETFDIKFTSYDYPRSFLNFRNSNY